MDKLFLADMEGYTEEQVKDHICDWYEVDPAEVERYDVLVAYESVGDYGCDSASWFLMRDKISSGLFINVGAHCSCHGFEGQFEPEEVTLEYLQAVEFRHFMGGYDNKETENIQKLREFINKLSKG